MDKRLSELMNMLNNKNIRLPAAVSDDNTLEVAEKLLGEPITADNISSLDNSLLAKLDAYNARKALAEYLIRSNLSHMHSKFNRWRIPLDAHKLAMLSVTNPKDINSYVANEFLDSDKARLKDVLARVMQEVPDELYSEDDANTFAHGIRDKAHEAAVEKAKAEGDENPYAVYHEHSDNASELYHNLHKWDDKRNKPLVTDEEIDALIGDMPADNVREYYRRKHPISKGNPLIKGSEMTALGELAKSIMETELGRMNNDVVYTPSFANIDFSDNDWERHAAMNNDE